MVDEVALLLPHPAQQLIQARTIIKLVKQADKEVNVAGGIDEMSSGTLELGSPNLDGQCLCEDLRQFLFGSSGSDRVSLVIVNYMGSLAEVS